MASPEDSSEESHSKSVGGSDEESDYAPSDSSSMTPRVVQDRSVREERSPRARSQENPSSSLLFNPNEKGTRKQRRCDYDSDDRSYDGLGFDYRRRYLPTTATRDSLLPDKTNMIDFDQEGGKTWGNRLLFETLKDSEIDSLVGLATSQTIPTSSHDDNINHNPQRHNPLLSSSFDAPFPPSHIDYIKSRIRKHALESSSDEDETGPKRRRKNNSAKASSANSSLNDSAGVAMGMYLEECITASLLPLAGLHVLRCRALAAMESAETEFGAATAPHPITGENVELDTNNHIRWREEESFQEWTLPPEEAILKLMEQGVLSNDALYQFVPNASRLCASTGSNDVPDPSSSIDIASLATLCKVNPSVISANREIFDIFLPKKNANFEAKR